MKNNKNKLNPHFFRKMSNGLDIALMFYKTRLNPQQTQKGNTLLIGLGFGLLVMLLGGLAIAKANNNKINATSNEFTQKSLAITQAGVNNLMAQLNQGSNKSLLLLNNDTHPYLGCTGDECNQWADADQGLSYSGEVNSCSSSASTTSQRIQGVASAQSVGAGNGAGEFKLLAYLFQDGNGNTDPADAPNTGTLLVEGNVTSSEGNVTSSTDSKSRFEVQIPVTVAQSGTGGAAASLMASTMNLGQTDVTGSITCTDPGQCQLDCAGDTPTQDELKEAIDAEAGNGNSGSTTIGTITIGGSSVPNIPKAPDDATVIQLGSVTGDVVVPRDDDKISPGGTYYYQVNGDVTGNLLIKEDNTKNFRIYVNGNMSGAGVGMEQTGTGDNATTNQPAPGQLMLFGGNSDGTLPANDQTWILSGGFCQTAFVHAPKANISFNGGGNGCKNFTVSGTTYGANDAPNWIGVVWAKSFIANSSNSLFFIEQPGLMTALSSTYTTSDFGPKVVTMGAGSTITRKEAN